MQVRQTKKKKKIMNDHSGLFKKILSENYFPPSADRDPIFTGLLTVEKFSSVKNKNNKTTKAPYRLTHICPEIFLTLNALMQKAIPFC